MSYYNKDPDILPIAVCTLIGMIILWIIITMIAYGDNEMPIDVVAQLKMEEGWRSTPYLDTIHKSTIGYGHLINGRRLTRIEHDRFFPGKVYHISTADMITYWKENPLSKEDGLYLLKQDIKIAEGDCIIIFGKLWKELPDEKKVPLLDLSFNLGLSRFLGFKKAIAAVKVSDWKKASDEVLDSRAAKQDPLRYQRIAKELAGK